MPKNVRIKFSHQLTIRTGLSILPIHDSFEYYGVDNELKFS